LRAAHVRDEEIARNEELQTTNLTPDEVNSRRLELRQLRELAFRADVKAKRVSKIKSKLYRKIHKKVKERKEADDGAESGEDEEDVRRQEVNRARERATLRHKNSGKWAKAQRKKLGTDISQRQMISQQLEEGERLRRKVAGEDSDAASQSDDNDPPEEKLRDLEADEIPHPDEGVLSKSKGVFSMKFMKDAEARQQVNTQREIHDLRQELTLEGVSDTEDPSSVNRKRVFGPTSVVSDTVERLYFFLIH
jgi:U3 small nucleolar RNA-associated protein 14